MLKQYHLSVVCRKDGREKTFYYTRVEEPGKKLRPGLRWGCNEKRVCAECRECWLKIRGKVV